MPSAPLHPRVRANGVHVATDAVQSRPRTPIPQLFEVVVETTLQTQPPRLPAVAPLEDPNQEPHDLLMAAARYRLQTTDLQLSRSHAAVIQMRDLIQLTLEAIQTTQQRLAESDRIIAQAQWGHTPTTGK